MGLLDGVLPAIYSAGNTAKRRLNGLLADPAGTMGLGVTRFAEDNNNLLNTMANAYPMAGDRTVLNTPKQNALARALLADKGTDMAMAGMTTGKFVYPQDAALAKAQANAALPIEKGGLGLGPNNTAAERAKAMGFEDAYHGTQRAPKEIKSLSPQQTYFGEEAKSPSLWTTSDPSAASGYANWVDGVGNPTVYPVSLDKSKFANLKDHYKMVDELNAAHEANFIRSTKGLSEAEKQSRLANYSNGLIPPDPQQALYNEKLKTQLKKKGFDGVQWDTKGYTESELFPGEINEATSLVLNPASVRSRFAAFDPMRRNEADLLGRADPNLLAALAGGGLLGLGGYKAMSGDKK